MNADHRDALRRYCQHFHQCTALVVEMLGIDCDGFDLRADGKILRFNLPEMVQDAQQARHALVAMVQEAQ